MSNPSHPSNLPESDDPLLLFQPEAGQGPPPLPSPAVVFGPRPFYICAHNPNSFDLVVRALAAGANALEPDVNVFKHRPNELCISHGGTLGTGQADDDEPALVPFLQFLRQQADRHPQLSLVVFDCKPATNTPDHGVTLLNAIREHLTDSTRLNVIISVATMANAAMFDKIAPMLRDREGVMIDAENDPVAVSKMFVQRHVTHQGFGNGISVLNSMLGPNVRPSMERACALRAEANRPRFIYVWTVNSHDLEREYIRIGVDGIISDDVAKLREIVDEPELQKLIRLATRDDDPFHPPNMAYGLDILTGDAGHAGTDAHVTFTVHGTKGSSSVRVDTSMRHRMERNMWNFVTLPSDDLGPLTSITVQRDSSGIAPAWFLDQILVRSVRYQVSGMAVFRCWIDSAAPFTRDLVNDR
jgi:glycerophosphoryl diester phosphodiesterase